MTAALLSHFDDAFERFDIGIKSVFVRISPGLANDHRSGAAFQEISRLDADASHEELMSNFIGVHPCDGNASLNGDSGRPD